MRLITVRLQLDFDSDCPQAAITVTDDNRSTPTHCDRIPLGSWLAVLDSIAAATGEDIRGAVDPAVHEMVADLRTTIAQRSAGLERLKNTLGDWEASFPPSFPPPDIPTLP